MAAGQSAPCSLRIVVDIAHSLCRRPQALGPLARPQSALRTAAGRPRALPPQPAPAGLVYRRPRWRRGAGTQHGSSHGGSRGARPRQPREGRCRRRCRWTSPVSHPVHLIATILDCCARSPCARWPMHRWLVCCDEPDAWQDVLRQQAHWRHSVDVPPGGGGGGGGGSMIVCVTLRVVLVRFRPRLPSGRSD